MYSTTLKRSAATLGVLAGLLDELKAPANAVTASISAQSGLERIAAPAWDGSNKQSAYFLELSFDAKSAKEGLYFKAPGPTDATQVGSEGVNAPSATDPSSEVDNAIILAGTETGNPERKGSFHASGGWDPTHALNSQDIALHGVATAVVGGLVPGGAIVSA